MTEPYKTYLLAGTIYLASLFFPYGVSADCLSLVDLNNGDCLGYLGATQALDLGIYEPITEAYMEFRRDGSTIGLLGYHLPNVFSLADYNGGFNLFFDYSQISGSENYSYVLPAASGTVMVITEDLYGCLLGIDEFGNVICNEAGGQNEINILEAQAQENLAHGVYIFLLTMFFMVFFFKRGV